MADQEKEFDLDKLEVESAIAKVRSTANKEIQKVNSAAKASIARVASAANASIQELKGKLKK